MARVPDDKVDAGVPSPLDLCQPDAACRGTARRVVVRGRLTYPRGMKRDGETDKDQLVRGWERAI